MCGYTAVPEDGLFVILCCAVTNFSADYKASGVEFCTAVYQRLRQGVFNFG